MRDWKDLLADSSEPHDTLIDADARENLQSLQQEAEEAGITIEIDPSYMPVEGTS